MAFWRGWQNGGTTGIPQDATALRLNTALVRQARTRCRLAKGLFLNSGFLLGQNGPISSGNLGNFPGAGVIPRRWRYVPNVLSRIGMICQRATGIAVGLQGHA